MNFNFGEVLTRAWQITWKYKVLWIFGILASCGRGGGNGGGSNSGGGRSSGSGDGSGFDPNNPFPRDMFQEAAQWLNDNWWIIALIVLAVIVLSLLFYYLGTIGKIALIKGTFKAEQGVESMSFGELWSESQPYFWRVFGLSFLIGLAFLVILLPIVVIGILSMVGLVCLLPLFCILIPIVFVLSVIVDQADAAIVLEDKSMFDGFKRGWEVAKNNVGPMIVMALILGIGGAIVGFIIALPIIIIAIPVAFGVAATGASGITNNFSTPIIIGLACCVLYFPILLVINGVLTTYIQSAWTLTFMRLTKPQDNAPVFITGNAQ